MGIYLIATFLKIYVSQIKNLAYNVFNS